MMKVFRLLCGLCVATGLVGLAGTAQADKVNLVYVEGAPAPIGSLTMAQIDELAASDFTHIVFAFINLCTPPSSSQDGPSCPGTAPVPVWNIGPAYHGYDGAPFVGAQNAMKKLADAGKTLYMSIGGAVNPETWQYMANATSQKQNAAAQKLVQFMQDYHLTGVDFDFEAGPSEGFGSLASNLNSVRPNITYSSAPYKTDPTATSPISTQWQYCTFKASGVTPTLINRQYYSGGGTNNVPAGVSGDLAAFTCDGTSIAIPQAQMNPGIGIPGQSNPNNCSGPTSCAAIGASVVAAFPDIAGMSLWNYEGLSEPTQYACKMGNALNGTHTDCNIAGDGPTQNINAGPIWNNDDAKVKCPVAAAAVHGKWGGTWTTTVPGKMSVCGIENIQAQDVDAGPILNDEEAKVKCPVAAAAVNGTWNGQWTTTVEGQMSVCSVTF